MKEIKTNLPSDTNNNKSEVTTLDATSKNRADIEQSFSKNKNETILTRSDKSGNNNVSADSSNKPEVKKHKKKNKEKIQVAIDAEWDSKLKLPLCVSMSAKGLKRAIYFNLDIKQKVTPAIWHRLKSDIRRWGFNNTVTIIWAPFTDYLNKVEHFISQILLKDINNVKCDVLLYFSPKDIEYAFGFDNIKNTFSKEPIPHNDYLMQKRCIKGRIGNYTFHDLYGWFQTSLKKAAVAVNAKMRSKDDMDNYKSNMLEGLIDKPEKFLAYAIDDVDVLHEVKENFTNLIEKDICKDLLGIKIDYLSHTSGALVAKIFETWIYAQVKDVERFKLALARLGQLDTEQDDYTFKRKCWRSFFFNEQSPKHKKKKHSLTETELKTL